MKPSFAVAFCLVTTSTTLSAADWQETKSDTGNFRVEFPAKPTYESDDTETDLGTVTTHYRVAEVDGGGVTYMVNDSRLSKAIIEKRTYDQLLDDTIAGIRRSFRPENSAEATKVSLGKHGGRALEMHAEIGGRQMYMDWRIFLVDDVLIQIGVCKLEPITVADRERFFKSLKLLKE